MDTIANHWQQMKSEALSDAFESIEKGFLPGNRTTGMDQKIIDWKRHQKGCRLLIAAGSLEDDWQQ